MIESRPSTWDRLSTSIFTSLSFVIIYNTTNWISSWRSDHLVAVFSWERSIPFVPALIVPYWSIDIFFVLAPFFVKSSRELQVFNRRILATILIAAIFFLIFPLQLTHRRPDVSGGFGFLFRILDNFNNFWNLAPSLHIALRAVLYPIYCQRVTGIAVLLLKFWFGLIWLSPLLCWQHHVIDVFTGQLLGWFVLTVFPDFTSAALPARATRAGSANGKRIKIGLLYLSLSIVLGASAFLVGLQGILFLWPATACLVFALAYLNARASLLGKEPSTGRISCGISLLLLPVTVVAKLVQRFSLRGEKQVCRATPNLAFGPHPRYFCNCSKALKSRPNLEPPTELSEFLSVIDLTAEYSGSDCFPQATYCPLLDLVVPDLSTLQELCLVINQALLKGPVYVHCALGRGRSGIVIMAWQLQANPELSIDEVIESTQRIAPAVVVSDEVRHLLGNFKASTVYISTSQTSTV